MTRIWQSPGVLTTALMLLAGVLAVQWLPVLPPRWVDASVFLVALLALWRWPRLRLLAVLLLGFAWAAWHGSLAMGGRLPRSLEGRDFSVVGRVEGLPQADPNASSFMFVVEQTELNGKPFAFSGRVRLNWYGKPPTLQPCSHWQLLLRLRRPRGMVDPGGGDSEKSALQRGIVAVGYVRDDAGNRQRGSAPWCIDQLRDRLANDIVATVPDSHDAALLRAFTVGDTRGLDQHDWDVARANGISHLIAISGFHVGVAAMFGVGFATLIYALWPTLGQRCPRPIAHAAAAFLMAFIYSALAGFGLPTVRTLLMIAVVVWARCTRRFSTAGHALALALMLILLVDPLAVLGAGFWLSFIGVALLLLCLDVRGRGIRAFLRELSLGQLVMTVGLLPLTLWFFGEASLLGVFSNLIAVPFVSFVVVPCALCGLVCLLIWSPLAMPALWLAAKLTHAQWWLLEHMATWPGAHAYLPEVRPWALLLAMLGAWWLLMPRGTPARAFGLLLWLPLIWPPEKLPVDGAFQVWMLDVGQGLSMIVRTREHALVYDTGAHFSSGFDLGEAVVIPSLHALGINHLDVLMVSHADNDHAGGAAAVAAAFPDAVRYGGEPERMTIPMTACEAGQTWQWDNVHFRVLYPAHASSTQKNNDRSCVLLVEGASGRMLLTGDIASDVEPQVAAALGSGPRPVLQVPHHGSKTSSSAGFIAAVDPALAIVSAGWRNRFGHPRPEVLRRYGDVGVPVLNTAIDGAIQVDFPVGAEARVVERWRQRDRRYWRE